MTLFRYLISITPIGAVILLYFYLSAREERLKKQWKLIAEGEYIKVTNKAGTFNIDLGIAGQRSGPLPVVVSTIFFSDDRTVKVAGINQFPPVGTYIRVYKNPLPEFKIEIENIPPSNCL